MQESLRGSRAGTCVLRAGALPWRLAWRVRSIGHAIGALREWSVGVPVVSVGGLMAGGSGKTPIALDLTRRIATRGHNVALVSRGYGGAGDRKVRIVSKGDRILSSVAEAGDEAIASAQALLGAAAVVVGSDRLAAAMTARDLTGARIVVLDDGFQHRRLARDLDLVVMPNADTESRGDLAPLPAGRMREPWAAAARADLRLFAEPEKRSVSPPTPNPWAAGRPFDPDADVAFAFSPGCLRPLRGGEAIDIDTLRNEPVALVAAIARPESFEQDIRSLGANPVARLWKGDHHFYDRGELDSFLRRAQQRGARGVVATTKDAVKLAPLIDTTAVKLRCLVFERKLTWDEHSSAILWTAIERVCAMAKQ